MIMPGRSSAACAVAMARSSSVLGRRRRHGRGDLVDKRALHPETARPVDEALHLPHHHLGLPQLPLYLPATMRN